MASLEASIDLSVANISRVQLQPGDVIVVSVPDKLPVVDRERLHKIIRALFPDHVCLVLDGGATLGVISASADPKQAARQAAILRALNRGGDPVADRCLEKLEQANDDAFVGCKTRYSGDVSASADPKQAAALSQAETERLLSMSLVDELLRMKRVKEYMEAWGADDIKPDATVEETHGR